MIIGIYLSSCFEIKKNCYFLFDKEIKITEYSTVDDVLRKYLHKTMNFVNFGEDKKISKENLKNYFVGLELKNSKMSIKNLKNFIKKAEKIFVDIGCFKKLIVLF